MPKTRPLRNNEHDMFVDLFETLNEAKPVDGTLRQRLRAFFQDYPLDSIRIADGDLLR